MGVFRRRFRKPNNIYECCRLLCLVQFLFGCNGLRSHSDKFTSDWKSLTYTFVSQLATLLLLSVTAYVKFQDSYLAEMDSLIKGIIYLELGMSLFMYLVTTATMLIKVRTHLALYQRLFELDGVLIREFRCDMKYEKLVKKHLMLLCFLIGIYVTITAFGASQSTNPGDLLVNVLAGIAYTIVTGGPHMNGYVQMNFAEILAIRFRLLQKLLKRESASVPQVKEQQMAMKLQRLIDLVQQYHDCVRTINAIFSTSLAVTMLHDFTLVTSELYLIFSGLTGSGSSALTYFVLLGIVLPFYKMTVSPVYSENSIDEGNKCFKIIEDIDFHFPGNMAVRQMVSACLMWRFDNPIQFISGSMIMNKEVIAGVYLQIFNYILILIQFRMTQEMGDQIEKQKNTIQDWIGVDYL